VKKSLIFLLAIMFLMATAVSFAGDTKEASSSDKTIENPHANCPMMNKASEEAPKGAVEQTSATEEGSSEAVMITTTAASQKVAETCPDVTGKTALSNFHEVMSPMHMAFEDDNYTEMKSSMPRLLEVSKEIEASKCPSNDKCSPDCLKKFDEKKADLLKGVENLDTAFKGDDTKKIDEAFMAMHQAFVDFAGVCTLGAKDTGVKATEVKSEVKNEAETK
jgi:hypothetical protein